MTPSARPGTQPDELALLVARELPYDDRYQFPRRLVAERITTSFMGGGLESAAEDAYLAGFRVGERAGQLTASRAAYHVFDEQWRSEPPGTMRDWLAACVRRAEVWESDSSQEFYLSYYAGVTGRAGRRVIAHVDEQALHAALPKVAGAAFTDGVDAGRSRAEKTTQVLVGSYARDLAAELGIDPVSVERAVQPLTRRPRRSTAGSAEASRSPSTVARLSFAGVPDPAGSTPPTKPAPRREPRSNRQHR